VDKQAVFAQFQRFLDGPRDRPVAVAVSGGGDSVALLRLLVAWGQRPLEVFHVDHGLNPLSTGWSGFVATLCRHYNVPFHGLRWEGPKPATGVSAKARAARFGLIFNAVRARNIKVVCMGHTYDDVQEAQAMRAEGSNVSAPQMWSPAPLWPQGRGLFCHRPLLRQSRQGLRDYLHDVRQDWIDDPSNTSGKNLRSRVRLRGQFCEAPPAEDAWVIDEAGYDSLFFDPENWMKIGYFRLNMAQFFAYLPKIRRKIFAAAVVCAGGAERLPRSAQIEALLTQKRTATVCGAQVWFEGEHIHICRAAHDHRRVAWANEHLIDGRFGLNAVVSEPLLPLFGRMQHLVEAHRAEVMRLPAWVRPSLPCFALKGTNNVALAHKPLRQCAYAAPSVTFWPHWRLKAALGLMDSEAKISEDEPSWMTREA
jgi:tRNA(Ile)-lysidine synthase